MLGFGVGQPWQPRTIAPTSRHIESLDERTTPIRNEYQQALKGWRSEVDSLDGALRNSVAGQISSLGAPAQQGWLDQYSMAAQGAAQAGDLDWLTRAYGGDESSANSYVDVMSAKPAWEPYQQRIDKISRPFLENEMRQQQAYDWMQGGNQDNALMSPDYANAGFNTITGMSNPSAGPGQIDGIGMDWAQGVYDPTTQQGTGTYQPGWQRNAGFGW